MPDVVARAGRCPILAWRARPVPFDSARRVFRILIPIETNKKKKKISHPSSPSVVDEWLKLQLKIKCTKDNSHETSGREGYLIHLRRRVVKITIKNKTRV